MQGFSANVSMLFTELPFIDRFAGAAEVGFAAVECWWPAEASGQELREAVVDAGVQLALLNFDGGDLAAGDRGLVANPATEARFRDNVVEAVELAVELGCPTLNALAGLRVPDLPAIEQWRLAVGNVRWAADRARRHGVTVVVEPINSHDVPGYLLPTVDRAAEFVLAVDRPNVGLQLDLYHAQRSGGDLARTIQTHDRLIRHVQLADVPGRHEPGTGEIRFGFLARVLERAGYDGYLGLEYVPSATTEAGLEWLPHQVRSGRFEPPDVWPTG